MFAPMFTNQRLTITASYADDTMRSSQALYNSLVWSARIKKFFGQVNPLQSLYQVEKKYPIVSRVYIGLQAVEISRICGSESRSLDFDRDFNPLTEKTKDRWLSIATAHQNRVALPPIQLIKIGEDYFVRDGHHRISVAKSLGESFVDAIVTEWKVVQPSTNVDDQLDLLPLAI